MLQPGRRPVDWYSSSGKQARRIGAMPLPVMLNIAEPGRGFHSGGSFPMATDPCGFQTDSWAVCRVAAGACRGRHRVSQHPGHDITFSVMANAHRIGWEAAQEGRKPTE